MRLRGMHLASIVAGMGSTGRIATFAISIAVAAAYPGIPTASADEIISGCESFPIFGLSPKIRKICDTPIRPDGTWMRWRQFVSPQFTHSRCGIYSGPECPPWETYDVIPANIGDGEVYYLTHETVPPGEPGHLDNPVRCAVQAMRCEVP